MVHALPLPPSLWAATARPAPETPPLDASRQADVAIVGAGYSGLAAALQLAQAGISVVVLEAGEPGWGASGRNGGQVIPGLKHDPDELVLPAEGPPGHWPIGSGNRHIGVLDGRRDGTGRAGLAPVGT